MPAQPKKTSSDLNFESAMVRLEAIVEQMDSGKLALEELILRYEEGMKLVKVCQEKLASAEQRIEMITRDSAGKAIAKNFKAATETTHHSESEEKPENDAVSLF